MTLCVLATVCIWKTLKTALKSSESPTVNIYFDFAIRDCSMHINAYVETVLPRTHKVTLLVAHCTSPENVAFLFLLHTV